MNYGIGKATPYIIEETSLDRFLEEVRNESSVWRYNKKYFLEKILTTLTNLLKEK